MSQDFDFVVGSGFQNDCVQKLTFGMVLVDIGL